MAGRHESHGQAGPTAGRYPGSTYQKSPVQIDKRSVLGKLQVKYGDISMINGLLICKQSLDLMDDLPRLCEL